jgi:hypothetical protein
MTPINVQIILDMAFVTGGAFIGYGYGRWSRTPIEDILRGHIRAQNRIIADLHEKLRPFVTRRQDPRTGRFVPQK